MTPHHPRGAEPPPAVLVLEAYTPTRVGYQVLLSAQPWVGRVLTAVTAQEGLAVLARQPVALVLVGALSPPVTTEELRELTRGPSRPAVVVAPSRPGADPADLIGLSAVTVAEGPWSRVLSAVAAALGRPGAGGAAADDGDVVLSDREVDVLRLLATGATNREIARRLRVGPDAVKKHAAAIYRKLGVRNRTEATIAADRWIEAGRAGPAVLPDETPPHPSTSAPGGRS